MLRPSKKFVDISILCFGLIVILADCGSRQSAGTDQGDRTAQGQVRSQQARILTNQVGYEPTSAKKAVIQGDAGDTFAAFTIKSYPGGEIVLTGAPVHVGPVAKWKDWDFWTVDWSAVTTEGAYIIELSLIHISEPTRQAEISYAVFCLKKKKKIN